MNTSKLFHGKMSLLSMMSFYKKNTHQRKTQNSSVSVFSEHGLNVSLKRYLKKYEKTKQCKECGLPDCMEIDLEDLEK